MTSKVLAAIEAGGTKFIVSVGEHWQSANQIEIPTTSPTDTMAAVVDFLRKEYAKRPFCAVGLASFGPICIDPLSPNYGEFGATPKPGWSGFKIRHCLATAFDVPIAIDTDVNGAAIAEARCGAGRDAKTVVYATIGTGVGVGVAVNGQSLNGISHPEIGHIRIPRHPDDAEFSGTCPFHGDCLEGLACGPSIIQRYGSSLSKLPDDHPGRAIEAHYLGTLAMSLVLHFMPDKIIFGGGVAKTPGLVEAVRDTCRAQLAGYLTAYNSKKAMETLIQRPGLGLDSGIAGAFTLAAGIM